MVWPAPISPTTGRCTGRSAVALGDVGVRPRRTRPSRSCRSSAARSARRRPRPPTSPRASISGWSKGGSGSIAASIRSRWSSTETSSSVMLQDATRPATRSAAAGLQGSTSPTTLTCAPKVQSPSTVSDVASRSDGAPSGKRLSNSRHQLVVRRVEVDERHLARPGRARSRRRRRRRRSAAPAGRWWSSPARTGRGRPRSCASPRTPRSPRPSRSRSGSPRACDGSAGSTVLTLRISGRPRMPSRRVERLAHRAAGRTRGCWSSRTGAGRGRRAPSWSSGRRLRGLAEHDPAVGLAAGEVAALAVGRRTAHGLDRERRTRTRRTSRRPAASGTAPRLSELETKTRS